MSDGGDSARWGARTQPLPGNDARERAADIPNGELALARFGAWYAGMRGTLYVSRSYAAFAAGGARRLLLPLAHVGTVRCAPGGRLQRAGVVVRPDAGGEFAFALACREDGPCAVRLLSVLAQRARSGTRLAPLPASAGAQLARVAGEPNGLSLGPRVRHRRRKSRTKRSAGEEEEAACDADVDEVEGEREAARRRARMARRARRHQARKGQVLEGAVMENGVLTKKGAKVEQAVQPAKPLVPRVSVMEKIGKAAEAARTFARNLKGKFARTGLGSWCALNLFDLLLCIVTMLAIIIAVVTLRMAETYTLHLRILGISIMSANV